MKKNDWQKIGLILILAFSIIIIYFDLNILFESLLLKKYQIDQVIGNNPISISVENRDDELKHIMFFSKLTFIYTIVVIISFIVFYKRVRKISRTKDLETPLKK